MTQRTKPWFTREGFRSWLIGMIAAVLIIGTILTWWMVQRVDREMREVLLLEARLVERSLNINRIKALTGTDADLENPDYLRLKEQLSLIRKDHTNCRFLYLMGRRADGNLFIFVDSEPTDSKDYSPPGQSYREAPEGYRRVFDTREKATIGPVSDRWGRWITALVPVIDPVTSNLVAVMGMDIDARTWRTDLAATAALPASSMLALMITLASLIFAVSSMSRLRKSEILHETILETTGTAILIIEEDMTISFVNKEFEKMTGYPQEEVVNQKKWTEFVTEADLEWMIRQHNLRRTAEANLARRNYEFRLVNREGRLKDVYLVVSMIPGTKKTLASLIDLTDVKQAQEALKQSESWYRTLFENTGTATVILEEDTTISFANAEFMAMSGYAKEEIEGKKSWTDFTFREDLDDMLTRHRQRRQNGEPPLKQYEFRFVDKGGRIRNIFLHVDIIPGTKKSIAALLDITDRKQAEESLKEAQRQMADIIDFLPDATFVIDKAGKVIAWNRAIEALTGVGKESILGKGNREYALHFFRERKPTLIDLVLQPREEAEKSDNHLKWKGNVLTGELHIPNLAGKEVYLLGTASILYDTKGSVVGAIETIRDVTERVRMEHQFHQAQKMEAIGALAGGIAHDFNNILGAVIGYTEIAQRESGLSPRLKRHLEQIHKAGERATQLVQQILTFSRQAEERPQPIRIRPIIKEALHLLRASLPSTILIHQEIRADHDMILADPTQIHQIMMNLCTNAAHAMREAKGELTIRLAPAEVGDRDAPPDPHGLNAGRYLVLTVGDTGAGIEPGVIDRIFDPFFTTKKPGEGTGMGLAVVHGIVKNCGGAVTVKSEPGKGAEFNVYFPLLPEETEGGAASDAMADIAGGIETLLFIDDEESLVQVGLEMLEGLGYKVIGRTSSPEGLELFRAQPDRFDLVITDMTMPILTGIDLVREIKRIRPGMPVILCSGFNETMTREKAMELGVDEFILKPIVFKHIAPTIRRVLDGEIGPHDGIPGNKAGGDNDSLTLGRTPPILAPPKRSSA